MRKPIIGIVGSILFDRGDMFPGYERAYVNNNYIEAVENAGGVPLILPIISDKNAIKLQLGNIDGLIISGGYDVNPLIYGEEPAQKLGFIYPARDEYDINVIEAALELKKPILGICRGIQILNVFFGGTLYQDLELIDGCFIKHLQSSTPDTVGHTVNIEKETRLFTILGSKAVTNSFHHQAIKELAPGLKISAKSEDGIIEGIESENGLIMGIQWHPEMLAKTHKEMLNIFKEFINR